MLRWLVVASLLGSACKVVNTTAGADASGSTGIPVVGFAQPSTIASEGSGIARFDLVLNTQSDDPVTVTYTVIDGSAFAGVDYSVPSGTITFFPGQTTITGGISLINDGLDEPDESFRVALVTAQGAQISSASELYVTIASNAVPRVYFETSSSAAYEGTSITVPVVLNQPSSQVISVDYVRTGTTSFVEYSASPQFVSFAPGSIRELITISKVNDQIDEPDETIVLTLNPPSGALLGPVASHMHLNRDDDAGATVSFTQGTTTYNEGNTTQVVAINVHASVTGTNTITVPFSVHSLTTADSNDFTIMTPSPLTFPSGFNDQTIMVAINGDTALEGTEDIVLQLGTPTNATLGSPSQVTLRLTNDDCIGTGTFQVCPDGPLVAALTLPAQIDTNSISLCPLGSTQRWEQSGHPAACVVLARSIHVNSTSVQGYRALVLVATESITIAGSLDISARFTNGPGSLYCVQGAQPGTYAGGAGGSFMTAGGDGGAHHNPGSPGGVAMPALTSPPTTLRGGCVGQAGGAGNSGYGHGGGAVYFVAGQSITLQSGAIINASGDAGPGTTTFNGAGGGGSGGMIMFDAPTIQASGAYVVANGGGGGEGGSSTTYGNGGGSPNPLQPFAPALGGTGTGGGDGGDGFAQGSPATRGSNASGTNGAGGGGGGAGYIKTSQPLTGAFVSPAPL